MLIFKIDETQVKELMSNLLKGTTFDLFETRNIEVLTFTKFTISGKIETSYIEEHNLERIFCTWEELRPYIFNLIKGSKRPKYIKIVFSLPINLVQKVHTNANAMFLNFSFQNNEITFTTATTEKTFTMDKSIDASFNDFILNFFKINNFNIKILE